MSCRWVGRVHEPLTSDPVHCAGLSSAFFQLNFTRLMSVTHSHSADVMTLTGPRPQPPWLPALITSPYTLSTWLQTDYTASHTPGTGVHGLAARLLCSVLNTYDNMCSVFCMFVCLFCCVCLFVTVDISVTQTDSPPCAGRDIHV